MTEEDFYQIRVLSAKSRLAEKKLYDMTEEEKKKLKAYEDLFDTMPNLVPKSIFYYHDFLGIGFEEIADIINYTYGSTRNRYYEAKEEFRVCDFGGKVPLVEAMENQ